MAILPFACFIYESGFWPDKISQMLFTWDPTNLCIIFRWWHVRNTLTLLISLAAVAILTAGYEAVREASRRYDSREAEYANKLTSKLLRFHIFAYHLSW